MWTQCQDLMLVHRVFMKCFWRHSIPPKIPTSGFGTLALLLLLRRAKPLVLSGREVEGCWARFRLPAEEGEPSTDGAESTHRCVVSFEILADLSNAASKQKMATFCSRFISTIDGAEFQLQETCDGSLLDRTGVTVSAETVTCVCRSNRYCRVTETVGTSQMCNAINGLID